MRNQFTLGDLASRERANQEMPGLRRMPPLRLYTSSSAPCTRPLKRKPPSACHQNKTTKNEEIRKKRGRIPEFSRMHLGIEPDAGVEPATLRLRVSRSTD